MSKTSLSQKNEDTETLAKRILPSIARVRLSRQKCTTIGSCRLYNISDGWEKRVLLQDEMVSKVFNTRDLERALRHPDQETILVPQKAGINMAALTQICERHTQSKTIYFENGKEQ